MSLRNKLKSINAEIYPQHLFYHPEWLVLGVNNVCNLHCKMCDVGVGYSESNFSTNLIGSKPLHMPIGLIKSIIDQAARYYPNIKLGYAFTEPLAYIHLEESLHYAKEKGLYTFLTTNALVLPQKAQMLCQAGLNEIAISLDGTQEIHNEIRGNSKSFQNAIKGIEELLKNPKHPEIAVFFAITEWNITYMKSFVDYFKNYPIKQLGFMHTNFTTQSTADIHNKTWGHLYHATLSNTLQINLNNMDLDLLADQIKEIKAASYPFKLSFSPDLDSLQQLRKFYLNPEEFIGNKCNDVSRNMMIKSDGTVIPAQGRCYNLPIGNLYKQNLNEVWNGHTLRQLRTDLKDAGGLFPACSRCCSAF